MLALTADNASSNNTLTEELAILNPNFLPDSRVRCFLHICNLVAKSLLRIFDSVKARANDDNYQDLAYGAEDESDEAETADSNSQDGGIGKDDNSNDGFIDPIEKMDKEKRQMTQEEMMPVRNVLKKAGPNTSRAYHPVLTCFVGGWTSAVTNLVRDSGVN